MYLPTIYQIQDSNQSRSKQKTRVKLTSKHRIRKKRKEQRKNLCSRNVSSSVGEIGIKSISTHIFGHGTLITCRSSLEYLQSLCKIWGRHFQKSIQTKLC
ncbi:hypothetical protein PanWU01x14_215290 [Parasponia andersonii]|uniref:Uncharacterized protein n=1 Tax=Parasponia andersonii TaxID=3476 RepID=A0A2P5BS21_PARAD|nr:hypothetical protein PanWU01x14_215290 [Parasponia andersonii]